MSNRKTIPAAARNIVMVPLSKLKKSPKNVRKIPHTGADIAALAASIAAIGMLQYPVVEPELDTKGKPTGNYLVSAGEGRRLAQVLRAKRKEIKKDEPIPCILDIEHNAAEISLAENAIRNNMHPADEYEAFAALQSEHGMSAEDIAARFGVTPAVVKQRLKLGAVSPVLLGLYREGEMTLDQLTAFTVTDDHARQEQVWESLGYDNSRRSILRALTEGQVATDDRRVAFVGIEAYQAAGGTVIRDLFDEDGGYLADADLLNRLVRDKLQGVAETVVAEGWKWVEIVPEFDYQRTSSMGRIETVEKPLSDEDQNKLAALQERLEILSAEADEHDDPTEETVAEIETLEADIAALTEEVYDVEGIARAGAFVALGFNGEARIERGYLRPEDRPSQRKEANGEDESDGPVHPDAAGLSATLLADLTAQRTAALRNDLAQAPELALIAVTHALAADTFYRGSDGLSCLEIAVRHTSLANFAPEIEDSIAGRAIAARHQAWSERLPEDGEALWSFVAGLTMDDLLALLAHCASLSLDAVQRAGFQTPKPSLVHASVLAQTLPHNMACYWQPTVASYLGRVGKERILDAVREGKGQDAARQICSLKKQAMAVRAEQLLEGTDWLPSVLRLPAASESQAEA